jgi:hypothetical protein
MRPDKCPTCGGTDFHEGEFGTGLVAFPRTFANLFGNILVLGSVCLSCGSVAFHVDEATLSELRARNVGGKTKEAEL